MKNTRDKQSIYLGIGLISVALALSANSIISPILANINTSFPNATSSQIQVIYTLTSLVGIPVILLGGRLDGKIGTKRLILSALVLMMVGGMTGFFGYQSFPALYVASALIGGGLSLGATMLFVLIAKSYDNLGRAKWGGIGGGVFSISGVGYIYTSGFIAEKIGWRFSYLILPGILPLVLLAMFFLPGMTSTPELQNDNRNIAREKEKLSLPFRYIIFTALGFLMATGIYEYNANISGFTREMGFGGAVAASYASSAYMLAGIPSGFLCGLIFRKTKDNFMSVAALLGCAGFAVCAWCHSLLVLCIGSFLVGFSNGMRVPGNTVVLGGMLSKKDSAMGMAIYNSICNLGGFLSPYTIGLFVGLVGSRSRLPYIFCMIILAVAVAGYIFDAEVLVPRKRSALLQVANDI